MSEQNPSFRVANVVPFYRPNGQPPVWASEAYEYGIRRFSVRREGDFIHLRVYGTTEAVDLVLRPSDAYGLSVSLGRQVEYKGEGNLTPHQFYNVGAEDNPTADPINFPTLPDLEQALGETKLPQASPRLPLREILNTEAQLEGLGFNPESFQMATVDGEQQVYFSGPPPATEEFSFDPDSATEMMGEPAPEAMGDDFDPDSIDPAYVTPGTQAEESGQAAETPTSEVKGPEGESKVDEVLATLRKSLDVLYNTANASTANIAKLERIAELEEFAGAQILAASAINGYPEAFAAALKKMVDDPEAFYDYNKARILQVLEGRDPFVGQEGRK